MAKNRSARTRAARRQASPENDNTVGVAGDHPDGKTVVREQIAVLSVRGELQEGGKMKPSVSKGIRKTSKMSSKKRRRQMAAIDRAENITEKLAKKISDSKGRLVVVKERKKPWDAFNETLDNKEKKLKSKGSNDKGDADEWSDENEMEIEKD